MNHFFAKTLLLAALCCACQPAVFAQKPAADSAAIWHVETTDGNDYFGKVLDMNGDPLRLETDKLGVLSIPRSDIKTLEQVGSDRVKDGQFWFENPHSTRYFWGPSGYGLRKGEGYYQNTWVLLNQVSYGFTDNFTLGVGVVPLFLFGGFGEGGSYSPIWITPKVSLPLKKDKVNLGLGTIFVTTLSGEGGAGIAYGCVTFGSREKNGTLGLGYGYSTDDGVAEAPTLSFSYMARLNRRFYFLTENYFISIYGENVGVLSAGARYVAKKLALDFGLFRPVSADLDEGFFALPWLSITAPFGNAVKSK